jgi:methyltransferase
MPEQPIRSLIALSIVLLFMLAELRLSRRHERVLERRGALHPPDPVFATMRWAYPAVFAAMAVEGALASSAAPAAAVAGAVIFVAGKLLKLWAIAALGERWTYKVLVLPGEPLIQRGPYQFFRHPNYVGVIGELVGMALFTAARVTGPAGTLFFCWLLLKRISAEERALGLG